MYSSGKQNNLIGFEVFTQSDIRLGVVSGIDIDKQSGALDKIFVKKTLFKIPLGKTLIIYHSQIIRITDRKIIVDDGSVAIPKENTAVIYGAEKV